MALPVLDGNQSATTLSSVVTGGEHIVAHSVVSLGTTAISNINSAVSGSAVTIPGLARLGNSIASDGTADANLDFIKIGGHQDGQNQVAHIVHVSAGGAMKVDASGSSVTFSQAPVTFGAITGSASILNFPSTQTIAGTVTANAIGYNYQEAAPTQIPIRFDGSDTNFVAIGPSIDPLPLPISGTVAVGNSVTIGSLPNSLSIVNSSSVTKANVQYTAIAGSINSSDGASSYTMRPVAVNSSGQIYIDANPAGQSVFSNDGTSHIFVKPTPNTSVTIGSLPAISGTVTAGNLPVITDGEGDSITKGVPIAFYDGSLDIRKVVGDGQPLPVEINPTGTIPQISGTVTAAAPNGSLTTRFGTPTTANVSFATSAVTNASRKYLLIQNVTTGSNVITVGIGFTPTTTQGIQLTAGAGITFESSYIPTGQIFVLSSVTASSFTILEA